jgi:HEAT repeat protein
VVEAAGLASSIEDQSSQTIATLIELSAHKNAVLRYWGTMGLLMRGSSAVKASAEELTKRLDDDSPAVRLAAARAFAQYGAGDTADAAIEMLLAHADWSQHEVFTVMDAAAALETLGDSLQNHAPRIAALPVKGPSPHARYSSYVPRLVERLNAMVAGP